MRLPAQDRLKLFQSFLASTDKKGKVSQLCRESGISRKTFYKWLARYEADQGLNSLEDRTNTGTAHPRALGENKKGLIRKLAVTNPKLSLATLAKKAEVGKTSVYRHLKNENLLAISERLEARKEILGKGLEDYLKNRVVNRVQSGETISSVAKDENLARKTIYKWHKRYLSGQGLATQRAAGAAHWRHIPQLEEALVALVVENPKLSAHQLARELRSNYNLIVSSHGVHNSLSRLNLNLYNQRLAFAQSAAAKKVVTSVPTSPIVAGPLRLIRFLLSPFAAIPKIGGVSLATYGALALLVFSSGFAVFEYFSYLFSDNNSNKIGLTLASFALFFGLIFLIYSLKYYLTVILVLRFGRSTSKVELGGQKTADTEFSNIELKRYPFVSIHIPFYNERRVAERILTAVSNLDYPNFEVIIADDSTDATTEIAARFAANDPRIKLSHRESRSGYKGAALAQTLRMTDPRAEFIAVFDADFIPFPDTIDMFVKYFAALAGDLEKVKDINVAAVQGYQWHVLNKSENWITRGVRTEYAGSYVMERTGIQLYGGLNQIAGSVYMIRKDVLENLGWGTSITEDFELTLKLYEQGYKVAYTPYIQTPSECVSTIQRLIRQRMRWAEGHTHNVRRMFTRLMSTPKLDLKEKFEFAYLSPYYLQALFFLLGTLFWFISEIGFHTHLPYFTSTLGWSLIVVNFLSLPLMNIVGLFSEESEEKDYIGISSFVALTYILVPFQGFAALKGLLESKEGPWFRTPKTGHITDTLSRGRLSHLLGRLIPWRRPASVPVVKVGQSQFSLLPYLALGSSAHNPFDNFTIKSKKLRWLGKSFVAIILLLSLGVGYLAFQVPLAHASPGTQIKTNEFFITQYASSTNIASGEGINATAYSDGNDVSFTVDLPESGITVRHAYVEWWTSVGAQTPTSGEMKFDQCDGGCTRSNTTQTLGAAVATSGESQRFLFRMDASAEVTSGSHTYKFNAQLTGTSLVRNGDNAKLVVSYEFDDTSTTQLRTRKYYVACGTGTTTPTSGTVNPNITEGSASTVDAWVEYTGHYNSAGSGDGSVQVDITPNGGSTTTGATINTDDAGVSSYDILAMQDVTSALLLNNTNAIDLIHTTQAIANKCAELVVTYTFNPYATPTQLQGNTVVYAIGQNSGNLATSQTTIGAATTVTIAEASVTYDSVWVRYVFTDDTVSTFTPKVFTSRDGTGTTGSAFTMPTPTEETGKKIILFDITSYLSNSANFQSGDSVTIQAAAGATSTLEDVGAELVLSFHHDQSGGSLTGTRTVYWFVGQRTTAASADFTGSLVTFLPETSETYLSSAIRADFPDGIISTTARVANVSSGTTSCTATGAGIDKTTASYLGTGENMTVRMLSETINSMANMAGQTVSFCLRGSANVINDNASAVAYTTYSAANPTVPEEILVLGILVLFLPKLNEIIRSKTKRKELLEKICKILPRKVIQI